MQAAMRQWQGMEGAASAFGKKSISAGISKADREGQKSRPAGVRKTVREGQKAYPQAYDWDLAGKCLFVPIGNAGNVTAIMSGLLKLRRLGIISELPRLFGVQSEHADPVWRYYSAPKDARVWKPVDVRPSVAQAAMIGNPVSFPRVKKLADQYEAMGGEFRVVQVTEQAIMDSMIFANRHGHIACTQGG